MLTYAGCGTGANSLHQAVVAHVGRAEVVLRMRGLALAELQQRQRHAADGAIASSHTYANVNVAVDRIR
jgi:flavin-binding protein dodecin